MSEPATEPVNVATRLLRGGGARAGAYVAANGLAALTAAFLTTYLGTAGFGEYTLVMAMTAVALVISDSGTTNLAAREMASGDPRDRVSSLIGLRFALASLCAAVMVLAALALGWRAELVLGTALAGAGMMAGVTLGSYLVPAYADLELERVALNEFLYPAVASALVLAAVFAGAGVAVILATQLVSGLPLVFYALRRARGRMRLWPSFHPGRIAPLVLEAASFALAVSIGTLLCNIAQLSLGAVADLDSQGVAGLAWRIMLAGLAAAPVLVNGAIPALTAAGSDDERLATAVEKLVGLAAAAGGLIGVGAYVAAPTLVALLSDERYDGAIDVLRAYAPVAPLTFMAAGGGMALLALSQHRRLAAVNGLAIAVTIVATVLAFGVFDESGLAVGNLAGVLVLLAGQVLVWRGMGRTVTPSLTAVAKCLAVAAAASAIAVALPIPNVPQTIAGVVLYFAGLGLTRALPPEATVLLARLRPARRS